MSVTEYQEQTDEQLLERSGEEREVFGYLIERYESRLRRYLRRLMPGLGSDADDVLQEVFIKAYVNSRSFDRALSFSSWIYRIAHNEAVSWLRKKKARPETVDLGDDDLHTFTLSIQDALVDAEQHYTKDAVHRVLVEMPQKYRAVLVLRFLEGRSYEEIGDILVIPGGTVATLVHRAKKIFSDMYIHHEQRI
jgi:RNA polymerase sigma-70 factor, ECF subfamily